MGWGNKVKVWALATLSMSPFAARMGGASIPAAPQPRQIYASEDAAGQDEVLLSVEDFPSLKREEVIDLAVLAQKGEVLNLWEMQSCATVHEPITLLYDAIKEEKITIPRVAPIIRKNNRHITINERKGEIYYDGQRLVTYAPNEHHLFAISAERHAQGAVPQPITPAAVEAYIAKGGGRSAGNGLMPLIRSDAPEGTIEYVIERNMDRVHFGHNLDHLNDVIPDISASQIRSLKQDYKKEAGGVNPIIKNRFGYVGAFQFGKMALDAVGYYDYQAQKWTGKHGVHSEEDFLTQQGGMTQVYAYLKLKQINWDRALKVINSSPNAYYDEASGLVHIYRSGLSDITLDQEQVAKYCHLVGSGSFKDLVQTGKDSVDAYGKSGLEYATQNGRSGRIYHGDLEFVERLTVQQEKRDKAHQATEKYQHLMPYGKLFIGAAEVPQQEMERGSDYWQKQVAAPSAQKNAAYQEEIAVLDEPEPQKVEGEPPELGGTQAATAKPQSFRDRFNASRRFETSSSMFRH